MPSSPTCMPADDSYRSKGTCGGRGSKTPSLSTWSRLLGTDIHFSFRIFETDSWVTSRSAFRFVFSLLHLQGHGDILHCKRAAWVPAAPPPHLRGKPLEKGCESSVFVSASPFTEARGLTDPAVSLREGQVTRKELLPVSGREAPAWASSRCPQECWGLCSHTSANPDLFAGVSTAQIRPALQWHQ